MRRIKFGCRALDGLRYEQELWSTGGRGWREWLPVCEEDEVGYERQCLYALQEGLTILHAWAAS